MKTRAWWLGLLMMCFASQNATAESPIGPVELSIELVSMVRYGANTDKALEVLARFSEDQLQTGLMQDADRTAFWLNVYNAVVQLALKADSSAYASRGRFFRTKRVVVAGKMLSLDDIEHGLLRRSKIKWSGGYLQRWAGRFERKFRVDQLDWRIHFALNCGAASCPPILAYVPAELDAQLNLATQLYLSSEVQYDVAQNEVQLPRIFHWFRADFEGKRGIRNLLAERQLIPTGSTPKIAFKPYHWELHLQHYLQ
jgi:hypothetical protein